MRNYFDPISQIPTTLNTDQAWTEYTRLVSAMDADPALRLDAAHCQEVARAWKRWSELFLRLDDAA